MDVSAEDPVELPQEAVLPADDPDFERLRSQLVHRHLPALEEQEFVRWETDPLLAWRGPRFEEVAAVIATLHERAEALPTQLVAGRHRLEHDRETSLE